MKGMRKVILFLLGASLAVSLALVAIWLAGRAERREFRLDYPQEIRAYSSEFGLDAFLVAAVIHCESGNRPDALSPKGAVGLMQIMPETGQWIADKLQMEHFDASMLDRQWRALVMALFFYKFRYEHK